MKDEKKIRTVFLYKNYFIDFYSKQRQKVKDKIVWTFRLIETQQKIQGSYIKHIEGTDGLYEIRVQQSTDIFGFSASLMRGSWLFWQMGSRKSPKRHQKAKLRKH